MTLSMGKYCAAAGFGVCGVAAVVMVIPGCAVVTGAFGTSDCSERRQRTATLIPDWLSSQRRCRYTLRAGTVRAVTRGTRPRA